jgi:outer membrane protein assembly factor BamA
MGVKLSQRPAHYQLAIWKIALFLALCPGSQVRANDLSLLIQTVIVNGTDRPLQLETKAGQPLDRSRVARDVKRLWATGWFDDIRVEKETVSEGLAVRFRLTERPRYLLRRVRFEPRHFDLPAPVPSGTLVDRSGLERLAKIFQERLKDSGYRDAIVQFELIPTDVRQADVVFRVKQGRRYVIDTLAVSGVVPQHSRQAARILGEIRPRQVMPGIPGLWKGWRLRPQLNREALNSAVEKLRSSYISRGYLDATATVEVVGFEENFASLSIRVLPGTAYRVESLQISDRLSPAQLDMPRHPSSLQFVCHCLLKKRSEAERNGSFDFEAHLLVRPVCPPGEPWTQQTVSLSARTQAGAPFRVLTIEFRGNHHLSDLTLRRALLLSEGDWFDRGLLRRSLTRLNLTGLIHPVSEFDVEVQPDSAQHTVKLVIPVRERDRGRWSLGASAWGGLSRSSWFSIGSRLPNWGPSYLELPTYFVALNVTSPLLGLPLSIFNQPLLSISLARPYLPGQSWRSGFQVSPQATWHQMLFTSTLHQVKPRLAEWLQATSALPVPVQWSATSRDQHRVLPSGVLICEPSRKPQGRLLSYSLAAVEWLFPAGF